MLFPYLVSFTNKTSIPLDNLPKYNSYCNVLEVTNLYYINENLRFHHARFNNFYKKYIVYEFLKRIGENEIILRPYYAGWRL